MREVAWVVFDEIHYLRDKGKVSLQLDSHMAKQVSSWGRLGGDYYPSARQSTLRVPIGYNSQCDAVRGMDYEDAWPAVSCRVYGFSANSTAALLLSCGSGWDSSHCG